MSADAARPSFPWLPLAGFVAACAWPPVNFVNSNFLELSIGAYGGPGELLVAAIIPLVAGLVLAAIAGWWKPPLAGRVLTVLSLAVLLAFTSTALFDLVAQVFASLGLNRGVIITTLAINLAILVIVSWLTRFEPARTAVAIGAAVALALPLAGLVPALVGYLGRQQNPPEPPVVIAERSRVFSGESVYYIILDSYAGPRTWDEIGLDNDAFVEDMTRRGFILDPEGRSNYIATHVTLMAILEADYVLTETSPRYADRSALFPTALENGRMPEALRQFREAGYETVRISNDWGGCLDVVFDRCLRAQDGVFNYALDFYLRPTIISRFLTREAVLPKSVPGPGDALSVLLNRLPEVLPERPLFVFAHHSEPHDRRYTADCRYLPYEAPGTISSDDIGRQRFVDSTICANRMLLAVLDGILAADPGAIIVVQSDHGLDLKVDWQAPVTEWTAEAIAERESILNFIRLPPACDRAPFAGIGQINTMRLVLGCVARTEPQFLPEHTYVTTYETSPDFGLVRLAH